MFSARRPLQFTVRDTKNQSQALRKTARLTARLPSISVTLTQSHVEHGSQLTLDDSRSCLHFFF